jgi:hypothetical protein
MPLSPMGCETQVHEKTNKWGTWAYHLVDGWYHFTLPEHSSTQNCHIKHTKSKCLSDTVQLQHNRITIPSITHADKVMHALADCDKAIQGMTGKVINSQATQDLQHIVDEKQAHLQAKPNKFEKTITPNNNCNTQQVPGVQAPPSIPKPHTNDNRQITCSMQPQPLISMVPINNSTGKPISAPLVATTIKPTGKLAHAAGIKLTTLPAGLSKCKCYCKQRSAQMHNAATPTSPTPRIRTQAQVATAAA